MCLEGSCIATQADSLVQETCKHTLNVNECCAVLCVYIYAFACMTAVLSGHLSTPDCSI